MGQAKSQFSEDELQDYEDLTFFPKKKFYSSIQNLKNLHQKWLAKLSMHKILEYADLRVNPFGDRIRKVFSSSNDGDCTFKDFLDMISVFSEVAPNSVRAEQAFRIFDFGGDDMLGLSDLKQVIECLIGDHNRLPHSDKKFLIQNILSLDDDRTLSFPEF